MSNNATNTYVISSRYEYFTNGGKSFTNWFYLTNKPMSLDDANNKVKEIKATYAYVDRVTKLKHEYKVIPYQEYADYLNDIRQKNGESKKKMQEYYSSAEYKELQKRKRAQKRALTNRGKQ